MKLIYLFLFPFMFSFSVMAKGIIFDVNKIPLPDALTIFWSDVLNVPFMISPELLQDRRVVTLNISFDNDARDFMLRYLSNMNIKVKTKNGIDYIYGYFPPPVREKIYSFVYTPQFRTTDYLSSVVSGSFNHSNNIDSSVGSSSPAVSHFGDRLVFRGTKSEINELKLLLPEIDIRAEQVDISAWVFEVSSDERNGSGLQLAAKLLKNKLSISIGTRTGYGNFLQFSGGSLDALYEIFRTDNHFSLVTGAHSRVISGSATMLSGGASVPTLGSVTYQDGTPVQSVEYRNTGVTLQVKPFLTGNIITMNINEQLSDYAETTSGINNSPTFTTRQIVTDINMRDGDIILLSGLTQNKNNDSGTGFSFLPRFWSSKSIQSSDMDLLIILQAKRVR